MFRNTGKTTSIRRTDLLQKRYDRISAECERLKKEKAALESELEICKTKYKRVEQAEQEFMQLIKQAKQMKAQYEKAYKNLLLVKGNYVSEVNKLIEQIKH